MSNIAKNLKILMEEKKLTNYSLGKKAGLGLNSVSNIVNGRSVDPKASTLKALAEVLECTIDSIINHNDQLELKNTEKKIKKMIWNPELIIKSTNLISLILKEKNIKLNVEQAELVLLNIYSYTIRALLNNKNEFIHDDDCEPDYNYAEWIIERAHKPGW